eukprot:scaffold266412_cov18-Tisochrysis_lutea.AAC.2
MAYIAYMWPCCPAMAIDYVLYMTEARGPQSKRLTASLFLEKEKVHFNGGKTLVAVLIGESKYDLPWPH